MKFVYDHEGEEEIKVYLVGDFNKEKIDKKFRWKIDEKLRMKKKEGKYSITLKMIKGKHKYQFLVNKQRMNDRNADEIDLNKSIKYV